MPIRSGELFAGVGGLSLAVDRVFNAEPAWFCQFEPPTPKQPHPSQAPSKVLAYRWPTVPNFGDVTAVKWTPDCPTCGEPTGLLWRRDELDGPARKQYHCRSCGWFPLAIRDADPEADRIPDPVDVMAGGFPCTDVSLAGRRAGMKDGTRSGLWSEYAQAIDVMRPDWVVIENVAGLFTAETDSEVEPCAWCLGDGPDEYSLRALDAVLGDLATLGFDAEWGTLRASDVGAPHGRLRVFILAWPRERTAADASGGGGRGWAEGQEPSWGDDAALRSDPRRDGGRADSDLKLLPTPDAYAADRGGSQHPDKRREGGHTVSLSDVAEYTLLPTPVAQPSGNTPEEHLRKKPGRQVVTDLAIIAENGLIESGGRLLPTPTVGNATGGNAQRGGARGDEKLLPGLAREHATDWGPYTAAIRRAEQIIGRPAPAPVRFDGKGGKPRLNPELTEWMMTWPAGHVTNPAIGISRADQLKGCGNGVVTMQAVEALNQLLVRPGVPGIDERLTA